MCRPGDLVLFEGDPRSLVDRAICAATHGPYSHVEVIVAGARGEQPCMSIGALSGGVVKHPLPWRGRAHLAIPTGAACDPERLPDALAWLEAQVGDGYGWLDCVADGLRALLPARLGSRTPFLVAPHRFDCSHLAAVFLAAAGYPLPPAMVESLGTVSPNDLWRMAARELAEGGRMRAATLSFVRERGQGGQGGQGGQA